MNPNDTSSTHPDYAPDAASGPVEADAQDKLQVELADLKDAFLRAKAELENVRRQGQADVLRAHKFAIERFAAEILPVKDALEQSLAVVTATPEQLRSGVELTLKQLSAALEKSQITEIAAAGEKFDPHKHQAMAMVDADAPGNTVVQVFQKGYALNDRVLRPALVAVAKPKAEPANAAAGSAAPGA